MTPKNYPALTAALVQAVITLALGLGLFHWGPGTVGAVEAAAAAAVALGVALYVDKPTVAVVTGFLNAAITVLVAFKVPNMSPGLVSAVDAIVIALGAYFVHANVTAKANLPREPAAAGVPGVQSRRL